MAFGSLSRIVAILFSPKIIDCNRIDPFDFQRTELQVLYFDAIQFQSSSSDITYNSKIGFFCHDGTEFTDRTGIYSNDTKYNTNIETQSMIIGRVEFVCRQFAISGLAENRSAREYDLSSAIGFDLLNTAVRGKFNANLCSYSHNRRTVQCRCILAL